jgi:alkanesulfonate monooxygenase SsuD/methylene tetrahydromethanopterin reductase-like flavin-dependent oxidoreductase (luciferase family)
MNFLWFHLMPYRFLPDDFRQTNRSVWVDIPQRYYDPPTGHHLYNEFLDELEHADRMGFHSICVNEHHQNGYGMMPSPNLMAAALVRRAPRANICVLGNSIALYNPPIRVAEEFAMLDVLSGGRLIAGFPVGTSMDGNYCYGVNPATLRERYYEAHELIMKAWTTREPFAFNGKYTKLRYVNLWPRPIQQPHPPVWIPGGGSVETWDFCVENDYVYSYLSFLGYQYGKRLMDQFWERVAKMGGDGNPFQGGFAQTICVGETDADAEREYKQHVLYFYNRCLHIFPGFAEAPGYRTVKTLRKEFLSQVAAAGQIADQTLSWGDILERGYVVAGSPSTVRDRLRALADGLHVGQLMCLVQVGSMPKGLVMKNTELLAREVMPHLRDVWSGWTDRYSPRPLAAEARAVPGSADADAHR